MSRMNISAIIPVFNGEEFLAEAVESIRAQRVPPDEIIVVDDGSRDGSAAVAATLGAEVRVVRHAHNLGLPAARNTGVGAARGDVISFLDVDDLWSPDKLLVQSDILGRDPSIDVVVGLTQKMRRLDDSDDGRFEPWSEPELALSLGAALLRRRAFDRVAGFDRSLAFTGDWDWFMRAREQGLVITTHPDVVQYYRRHGGNMTEDIDTGNRDTLKMLKMSLERRRQNPNRQAASLPELGRE